MTETAGPQRPARPVAAAGPGARSPPDRSVPRRMSARPRAACPPGSDQILAALADRVAEAGLDDVAVKRVGCLGLCAAGPLVEVAESGRLFERVGPDDLGGLVGELQGGGRGDPGPTGAVLRPPGAGGDRELGRVDPEDLDDYRAPAATGPWRRRWAR